MEVEQAISREIHKPYNFYDQSLASVKALGEYLPIYISDCDRRNLSQGNLRLAVIAVNM
jgi:hypothetical protein